MPESRRGAIWGGASEKWIADKPKREQELATANRNIEVAIKDLPILFDTDNFQDLITHLNLLQKAEYGDLHVGDKKYAISTIKELIDLVIRDFSKEGRREKVKNGTISDEKITNYLKERGITGNKIDEESIQGFRECILSCIKNMCK